MLDTFSFEPYIKSYHWFTFRSLEFSEIAFRSLSSSPVCLSLLSLTADSATPPAAALGRPGQVRLRLSFTWRPRKLLDPLSPRAGVSTPRHATPASSAAATSPSPWPAQCSTPDPHLACAPAPGEPPLHFLLISSPAPHPNIPEHRRFPPELRRARAHRRPAIPDLLRLCRPYL